MLLHKQFVTRCPTMTRALNCPFSKGQYTRGFRSYLLTFAAGSVSGIFLSDASQRRCSANHADA